jgi:PhzF family phenazine biosynthesis protein
MAPIEIFQVDAFSDAVFRGNPAAVCPLDRWLPDEELQAIAEENNLAETAFFVPFGGAYELRWFTPRTEMDLCGHATLASAFVILTILNPAANSVRFHTRSGELNVSQDGDLLTMDFPSVPPSPCVDPPVDLLAGVSGPAPSEVLYAGHNYILILPNEGAVRSVVPNITILERLGRYGVAVTAPGHEVDFVSRYFAPAFGIPEDPVTGSLHCSLVPYWARRLGKSRLYARQLSERQGDLRCEDRGERVSLAGSAALYLHGTIAVPSTGDVPAVAGAHAASR